MPPTKIEIEGVKSGSRLSVKENEIMELKCVVHQAKPKAIIVWFRENAEFYTGKTTFIYNFEVVFLNDTKLHIRYFKSSFQFL